MGFKHMSYTDRLIIEKLLLKHTPVSDIAEILCVHRSTIYREIKRGQRVKLDGDYIFSSVYDADVGQRQHDWLSTSKGAPLKIACNHILAKYIEEKILNDKYSPAAVSADLRAKGMMPLCESTIYRYIKNGVFLRLSQRHITKKAKHEKIIPRRAPAGLSIELRPDISTRQTLGHWEIDTVVGKASGKNQTLLVLTERKTRYEIICKLKDRTSNSVENALSKILKAHKINSLTCDNGSEFATLHKLPLPVYYCHPYSSYERGSNENANRLIRRWYPKGADFENITQADCDRLSAWINNYPRQVLGWSTASTEYALCLGCL